LKNNQIDKFASAPLTLSYTGGPIQGGWGFHLPKILTASFSPNIQTQ